MSFKALESLKKTYISKPTKVEAMKYDGTEESATIICATWPDDFVVGVDKKDKFDGLYLMLAQGAYLVHPGEMAYHNVDEDSFFTMPEEDFFELFDEAKD